MMKQQSDEGQVPLPEYEECEVFEVYEPTQEELDWLAAQGLRKEQLDWLTAQVHSKKGSHNSVVTLPEILEEMELGFEWMEKVGYQSETEYEPVLDYWSLSKEVQTFVRTLSFEEYLWFSHELLLIALSKLKLPPNLINYEYPASGYQDDW
jgi:hypothetical protein